MKNLLAVAATSVATLNSIALAEVVQSSQMKTRTAKFAAVEVHAVTADHPVAASLEKAFAPSETTSKWTWIPAQRSNDGAPQTQIVAIPVPSPGAAALLGLSGLIFTRRRAV